MKAVATYIVLIVLAILLFLFLFKPEVFYRILDYKGPGGPFVHPPQY